MTRRLLRKLDSRDCLWLNPNDGCSHYGEYTSDGGYQASETNQLIHNLKIKPTSAPNRLHYKRQAINHWGSVLSQAIDVPATVGKFTFVPMPGSKPVGHPEYDDRMLQVLRRMMHGVADGDVRPLLRQTIERAAQHHGERLSPAELCQTLAVDLTFVPPPLAEVVVVVDDIITKGASFAAAKSLLSPLPGVQHVIGVFLAKAVRPAPVVPQITPEQLRALLGQ